MSNNGFHAVLFIVTLAGGQRRMLFSRVNNIFWGDKVAQTQFSQTADLSHNASQWVNYTVTVKKLDGDGLRTVAYNSTTPAYQKTVGRTNDQKKLTIYKGKFHHISCIVCCRKMYS